MDDSGPERLFTLIQTVLPQETPTLESTLILGMPMWGAWLLIALLLLVSALFSASENAFSNCDRFFFKAEAEKGKKTAKIVNFLAEHFEGTLVSVLVANNIVQTLMSSISAIIFYHICEAYGLGGAVEAVLSTVVMAFLVYVVSDTVPKILSKSMPNRMATFLAWPDFIIYIALFPISWCFRQLLKLVHKMFHIGEENLLSKEDIVEKADEAVTENELTKEEEEVLEPEEVGMLRKALALSHKKVKDVMTPASKAVYLKEEELSPLTLPQKLLNIPYTRIPVFDKDKECLGVLSTKTFFREYFQDEHLDPRSVLLDSLELKEGDDLLTAFTSLTEEKIHLALVRNEEGMLTGLLTLDDVLDELIPVEKGGE